MIPLTDDNWTSAPREICRWVCSFSWLRTRSWTSLMLLGTREPCVVDCCPNVVQSFSVFIHVQSPVFIRKHFHPPYVIHSFIHTHLRTLTKRKLTKIKCRETVWKDTSVAVFSLSSYRYLGDGRHEILHDGTGQIFSPFGGCPPNPKFWA